PLACRGIEVEGFDGVGRRAILAKAATDESDLADIVYHRAAILPFTVFPRRLVEVWGVQKRPVPRPTGVEELGQRLRAGHEDPAVRNDVHPRVEWRTCELADDVRPEMGALPDLLGVVELPVSAVPERDEDVPIGQRDGCRIPAA